jgi:hypothetical protein
VIFEAGLFPGKALYTTRDKLTLPLKKLDEIQKHH